MTVMLVTKLCWWQSFVGDLWHAESLLSIADKNYIGYVLKFVLNKESVINIWNLSPKHFVSSIDFSPIKILKWIYIFSDKDLFLCFEFCSTSYLGTHTTEQRRDYTKQIFDFYNKNFPGISIYKGKNFEIEYFHLFCLAKDLRDFKSSYRMNHAGYVLKFLKRKHKQSQTWWTLWSIFEGETLRNESSRYSSHSCYWKNYKERISIIAQKACFSSRFWIYRLLRCKKYHPWNACFLWNKKNCWFRQNIFLIMVGFKLYSYRF